MTRRTESTEPRAMRTPTDRVPSPVRRGPDCESGRIIRWLVAATLVLLSSSACSIFYDSDFEDIERRTCSTDRDCNADESCSGEGYCYETSSGDAGSDAGADMAGQDTNVSECAGGCPPNQVCRESDMVCVECLTASDCTGGQICTGTNRCVECLSDADCSDPTPRCDTSRTTCVECAVDADCTDGQTCKTSGTCM